MISAATSCNLNEKVDLIKYNVMKLLIITPETHDPSK